MKGRHKRKQPELVIKNGQPVAVILELDDYEDMLEQLEEKEDLKALEKLRKKPLKFKKLENFLKEHNQDV